MITRHNHLIDIVEQELIDRGYNPIREEEYNKGVCGEIDLYAINGKYILLFEMKTTTNYKTRKKAIEQMNRAERYCFNNKRVFKFYVSNYKNPTIEWIKGDKYG